MVGQSCGLCGEVAPRFDEGEVCVRPECPHQPSRFVDGAARGVPRRHGLGERVVPLDVPWSNGSVAPAPPADWEDGARGRDRRALRAAQEARTADLAAMRRRDVAARLRAWPAVLPGVDALSSVDASKLMQEAAELLAPGEEGAMLMSTAVREFRKELEAGNFDGAGLWLRRLHTWSKELRAAAGSAMSRAIDGALREDREDQAFGPVRPMTYVDYGKEISDAMAAPPSNPAGKIDTTEAGGSGPRSVEVNAPSPFGVSWPLSGRRPAGWPESCRWPPENGMWFPAGWSASSTHVWRDEPNAPIPPVMKPRANELVHAIEHLCGRTSIDDPGAGFLLRRFAGWNTCDREAWKVLRQHIGLRVEPGEYSKPA